jgi:monoamine oxidase
VAVGGDNAADYLTCGILGSMPRPRGPQRPLPLTRRRFLEQLGAIGGSSLVMTALSSMQLMAEGAGDRPQLSGRPARAKVLVLGCGVSGLVVGYELSKLGYDFQMLEARDRVGGLAWTVRKGTEHTEIDGGERQVCTWDEGQYVNVGPWRIPHSHTGVLNYCREVGVPLQIFLNESDSQYFYYEGKDIGPLGHRSAGRPEGSRPRGSGRHPGAD